MFRQRPSGSRILYQLACKVSRQALNAGVRLPWVALAAGRALCEVARRSIEVSSMRNEKERSEAGVVLETPGACGARSSTPIQLQRRAERQAGGPGDWQRRTDHHKSRHSAVCEFPPPVPSPLPPAPCCCSCCRAHTHPVPHASFGQNPARSRVCSTNLATGCSQVFSKPHNRRNAPTTFSACVSTGCTTPCPPDLPVPA